MGLGSIWVPRCIMACHRVNSYKGDIIFKVILQKTRKKRLNQHTYTHNNLNEIISAYKR